MSTETLKKDLLRGGQFLVKETPCKAVFTPEDLNEEQRMMRESTIDFVDRELWANWERFEKKDYAFTQECMRKAGEMGFLSIAVPEDYGGMGMGFVSTMSPACWSATTSLPWWR
jgi:alkylation response protein AidB-like acyl-CoA dehydrogenase